MRYLLLALFVCLILPFPAARAASRDYGKNGLVLYTALTATTPQIPLWAAIHDGWPGSGEISVEYWKTLDDLRGVMLAGKGDIWVGNLEGFAQAALRGAPVRLVAVTGWKKFSFITPRASPAADMEAIAAELRRAGTPLAVAPQDSPAIAILEAVKKRGGPSFNIAAMQPQQLLLEMLRGTRGYALLPEPFASSLLVKRPQLHAPAGLEEEYARLYGGPTRMPLGGIAVNARFAEREPEKVRELAKAMQYHAALLEEDTEAAIAVLPLSVRKSLGDDILRTSLSRDMILAIPVAEAKNEIVTFLRMILPRTDSAKLDALVEGPFLIGE